MKNITTKILLRPEKRTDYSEEIVRQEMTIEQGEMTETMTETLKPFSKNR